MVPALLLASQRSAGNGSSTSTGVMDGTVSGGADVSGATGTVVSTTGVLPSGAVVGSVEPSLEHAVKNARAATSGSAARRNDMCVSFATRDRVVASAQRATVALRET